LKRDGAGYTRTSEKTPGPRGSGED
jgi:hypothetical protein